MRVLVTGASAGIGRAAALSFAHRGFRVFATARRRPRLEALAAAGHGNIHAIELDVCSADSIAKAKERILELTEGYGVDVVVNNAGIALAGPLAEVDDAHVRSQFETNVFGLLAVTRTFLPNMMDRRSGRIVNVSSSGGRISLPLVGAYHASKFAVEALSDSLRWELSPFGIRVSVIEPGPVRTELGDKLLSSALKLGPRSAYAAVLRNADEVKAFAESRMVEPEAIVRDIEHAALAKHPRARYLSPRPMGFLLGLYQLVPTWLSDWVICRATGMTRSRLLLGA